MPEFFTAAAGVARAALTAVTSPAVVNAAYRAALYAGELVIAGLATAAVTNIPKPEAGRRPTRFSRSPRIYGVGGGARIAGAYAESGS